MLLSPFGHSSPFFLSFLRALSSAFVAPRCHCVNPSPLAHLRSPERRRSDKMAAADVIVEECSDVSCEETVDAKQEAAVANGRKPEAPSTPNSLAVTPATCHATSSGDEASSGPTTPTDSSPSRRRLSFFAAGRATLSLISARRRVEAGLRGWGGRKKNSNRRPSALPEGRITCLQLTVTSFHA